MKNGWVEAEWRWKAPSLRLSRGRSDRPLWLGAKSLAGKTLLLHNDQGFGDSIQFCRYIPLLAERGASVILEIDRSLKSLLSGVAGITQCVVKGETLPDHDLQCPLASLPLAFDTTIETIPSQVPYISIDDVAGKWEAFLCSTGKPRIGIVWSGNPDHTNDRNRSLPLNAFRPLFDTAAQFVSLQKNARAATSPFSGSTATSWMRRRARPICRYRGADPCLDLVITVDTSVAHLAGALGQPTWILLPYVPDYRWLLDRDDSPWYPTARLFRQTATRDYAEVIDRMRADLLRDGATLAAR